MPTHSMHTGSYTAKLMANELCLGQEINDIFVIASAQQGQARNGPYWRIEFRDSSGSIAGKIWSPQSHEYPAIAPGSFAKVRGRVTTYRDQLEIAVEALVLLGPEESSALDISQFLVSSPYKADDMLRELLDLADTHLTHWPWHTLVTGLLRDGEISMALRLAPAAKSMHHAYAGGLLEHTLSVARLCLRLADQYPRLDRQALFAGAVCHDLGKLWELSSGLVVEYTQSGKLLGHIFLFLDRLQPFIKRSGLAPELAEHLQHMILSHHGSYEFGSPRLPATPEALALHYADMLDAKMQQVDRILAGLEEQAWSPYVSSLERSLFKPKHTPDNARPASADIDKLVHEIDSGPPVPDDAGPDIFLALHTNTATPAGDPGRSAAAPSAAGQPVPHADAAKSEPGRDVKQPLSLFSVCSSPLKE